MKKIYLVLIFLISSNVFAQNIDSLYNSCIRMFESANSEHKHIHTSEEPYKCGLGIIANIKANYNRFTKGQKNLLYKILKERPGLQSSTVSPSGIFRIHYDTTGSNVPKYFYDETKTQKEIIKMSIDSLAVALDSSYNYEVNILGYPAPLKDGIEGGDDKLDIYLINMGGYGATNWDDVTKAAYISMRNEFKDTKTKGIAAAKVTAAHEFHHTIQVSRYSDNISYLYLFELTAVAMEEFVYDEINDYLQYLSKYFYSPQRAFNATDGYDKAIWYFYLVEKFKRKTGDTFMGHKIMKHSWELFGKGKTPVEAFNQSLIEANSNFKNEINEFGIWCLFTGDKSLPNKYFSEGATYPSINPRTSIFYAPPRKKIEFSSHPVSNNYIKVLCGTDTLMALVTNVDIKNLEKKTFTKFSLTISEKPESNSKKIMNDLYATFNSSSQDLFIPKYLLNNKLVETPLLYTNVDYVFPQPFRYNGTNGKYLYMPVAKSFFGETTLSVYNVNMELVFSAKMPVNKTNNFNSVKWDGKNNSGEKLATGVYIYVTKSGDDIKKGKFVIYND